VDGITSQAVETIHLLVAPVVLVSACGLLCLALYNRLTAVVGRIRAINKEEVDTVARISLAGAVPPTKLSAKERGARRLRERVVTLDEQVDHLMRRAQLVRAALVCLLVVVLSMLLCSLALGMSLFARWFATVALGTFAAGIVVMIVAVVLALLELRVALVPAAIEHAAIDLPDGLE